jgi:hypothetical protein
MTDPVRVHVLGQICLCLLIIQKHSQEVIHDSLWFLVLFPHTYYVLVEGATTTCSTSSPSVHAVIT